MAQFENQTTTSSGNADSAFSSTNIIGQNFTALSAHTISDIKLIMGERQGSSANNYYLTLYAVDANGFPTGSALATSDALAGNGITTSATYTVQTFHFSTPYTVSAGTKYAMVLTSPSTAIGSRCYWGGYATSNIYADGVALRNTGSWVNSQPVTGLYDFYFDIYGDASAPPPSGFMALL